MFGDNGMRADKLNAYAKLVSTGKNATAAFAETLGPIEALDGPFRVYFQRSIFSFRRVNIDVSVDRERFPVRPLPPAESASALAQFHAVMHRPIEARAAIAEARKADPNAAGSYVAEGLLADSASKNTEAKAAYAKAVELASSSPYAYYRLASLTWQPECLARNLDRDRDATHKGHRAQQPLRRSVRLAWRDQGVPRDGRPDGSDSPGDRARADGSAFSAQGRGRAAASGQERRCAHRGPDGAGAGRDGRGAARSGDVAGVCGEGRCRGRFTCRRPSRCRASTTPWCVPRPVPPRLLLHLHHHRLPRWI